MIKFKGTFFDGKTAKAHSVEVLCDGVNFHIHNANGLIKRRVSVEDCVITPPLGNVSRSIKLPDGANCETDDLEAIARLENQAGLNRAMRIVNFLESRWRIVAGCFAATVVCSWVFISFGIPFLAKQIAFSVPPGVMENISMKSLKFLDHNFLQPSELDANKTARLLEIFRKVHKEIGSAFNYRLEFRKSPQIGPNAFALPSGMIVMTDELVKLAQNDIGLIGIMAHEIAHVEKRHGLRSILQNTGTFMLISVLAGDVTSITSSAAALPTLLVETGYSRKFEREADHESGTYLIRKGWGTQPYQNILLQIAKRGSHYPNISMLSTHPDLEDRMAYLKQLEGQNIP
jgi:Zn-dependent protease with chaperone function